MHFLELRVQIDFQGQENFPGVWESAEKEEELADQELEQKQPAPAHSHTPTHSRMHTHAHMQN